MLLFARASPKKAISCPSGDHFGPITRGPPNEVSFTGFRPSLSQTQTSSALGNQHQNPFLRFQCPNRRDRLPVWRPGRTEVTNRSMGQLERRFHAHLLDVGMGLFPFLIPLKSHLRPVRRKKAHLKKERPTGRIYT